MWEIKCIVGDKKALEVVKLIQPHTLEPPVMIHISDGGIKANGHAEPEKKSWTTAPGGSVELMRRFVKGHKTLTARQMREHLEANGYSRNGYSYSLQKLLEEGSLKKTKEPRVYEVKL